MNVPDLLRDGTPIVCLPPHAAFQQEAAFRQEMESLLVADFGEVSRPAPRIRVEIVPDPCVPGPAAAQPDDTPTSHGNHG